MNVKADVLANWKLFRQAWEYYVTATELNKKSKEVQAGALCSVMGLECVKVMNSLTALAPEDKSDPEKILTALGNHFMPQKHLLFEGVSLDLPIKLSTKLLTSMLRDCASWQNLVNLKVSVKV